MSGKFLLSNGFFKKTKITIKNKLGKEHPKYAPSTSGHFFLGM